MHVQDVVKFLEEFAPRVLAEDWDNVGLLIGSGSRPVERVLTCLTLTPDVAREAVEKRAGLIVTHHPVLFRPVQRITDTTSEGRMLLKLIESGISVYSPHTCFDSAHGGINAQLAAALELQHVLPLREVAPATAAVLSDSAGGGRFGDLPETESLQDFVKRVKKALGVKNVWMVGDPSLKVGRVGVACGAAAEFMRDAVRVGCHVLLTGEARFHACLEAETLGIGLVLPGHYPTERPAVEALARLIAERFPTLQAEASQVERDPVQWV